MRPSTLFPLVLSAAFALLGQLEPAHAAITWTGDLHPADPTAWTSDTDGYIGKMAGGSLILLRSVGWHYG